eukprot:4575532-Prymnesium_polylepis.1
MVSNVLLGGLAGYYLQTTFIPFDEAEEIEDEWRRIFNSALRQGFFLSKSGGVQPQLRGGAV